MSASTGQKILAVVLFVWIGLPPGLCSLFGLSVAATSSHGSDAVMYVLPSLVGLAIFGLMLWLLIITWRRKSP